VNAELNEWNTEFLLTINADKPGSAMGSAIALLLEKYLPRFRAWRERTPRRGWHEIGWLDRGGRLLMIAVVFAVIGGPLCWLILR
jgi:membrane protein YqaA with SNARE-associated domain